MSFEEQLIEEINELRTNTKEYSQKVKKYAKFFANKIKKIQGNNIGIKDEEGPEAYEEAADFLFNFDKYLKKFQPSKGLGRICEDFMEKAQNIEPEEIKSIDLDTIISKYGSLNGNLNKVINFGEEDPEQVVISLIVCKGKDNLGNREFLLSDELMKVGVSFAQHKTSGYCTLIIACSKFQNIYDSDDYGFISCQKFNSKKEFPKKGQQGPYKNNKKKS